MVAGLESRMRTGSIGVYELPGGTLLVTNGGGVHEIDRSGALIRTVVSGVSARFITLVRAPVLNFDPPLLVPAGGAQGLALLALLLGAVGMVVYRKRQTG